MGEKEIVIDKKVNIIRSKSLIKKINKEFFQYQLKIPKKVADTMDLNPDDQIRFLVRYKDKKPHLIMELIKHEGK